MLLVKRSFAKQSIHEQNTQHTAECAHVHAAHIFSFVLTTMAYTRCLHSKNRVESLEYFIRDEDKREEKEYEADEYVAVVSGARRRVASSP